MQDLWEYRWLLARGTLMTLLLGLFGLAAIENRAMRHLLQMEGAAA